MSTDHLALVDAIENIDEEHSCIEHKFVSYKGIFSLEDLHYGPRKHRLLISPTEEQS